MESVTKPPPHPKTPEPDGFTGELHQIFEELMLIFPKLPKIEEEVTYLSDFTRPDTKSR